MSQILNASDQHKRPQFAPTFLPQNCKPMLVKACERHQEEVYRIEGEYRPNFIMRAFGAKPVEGRRVLVKELSGRISLTNCVIDFDFYVPKLGRKFVNVLVFGPHTYLGVLPLRCVSAEKNLYECSVDHVQYT